MSTKLGAAAAALLVLIPLLVVAAVQTALTALLGATQPTPAALADIPTDYLTLYRQAALTCPGLDWSILAAIGKIESDHGRSRLPGVNAGVNNAGAAGPMQFLAATFDTVVARHPPPPGGASPPSRYNPHDAVHAAAAYLCDNGADHGDLHKAIFAYNHADWYVNDVLTQARAYANTPAPGTGTGRNGDGDCNNIQAATAAALTAINYACGQRGLPYLWGGNGPQYGGFDCSGLTTAAYAAAGITLPRTAHTQFHAGTRVRAGEPLQPGDLVFYGTPARIHHVGLYIGNGQMINAPRYGKTVQAQPYRHSGDDYAGATRPTSTA